MAVFMVNAMSIKLLSPPAWMESFEMREINYKVYLCPI